MKKILIIGISLAINGSAVIAQTYLMSNSDIYTTCSGNFYDGGGPSGNYNEINTPIIVTFYPADTINQKLSMTFSSFVTDVGDHLIVYNGSSTAAPQIANLSGTIAPGTIISTASNGSLTFRFQNLCCNGTGAVAAGWAATLSCVAAWSIPTSGNITMMSSGTYQTCSANFYDIGGPSGNYNEINTPITVTFYPTDTINQKLSMTFSSFVTDVGDHLIVYNGSSTAAPQIANLSGTIAPGTIISTASNGSLTFRFQNLCCNGTGAVAAGWAATLSCVAAWSIPTSGNITMMSSGTYQTCSANFYDIGGPSGNYNEINTPITVTFYPIDTFNQKLSMTFSSFVTDVGDHLIVYNGSSTAAPQIANLSGTIAPGTIISTASNGSLTFRFQNLCCNGTGAVAAGWAATLSCVAAWSIPTSGNITMMSSGTYQTCSANFYDIGGPSGNYNEINTPITVTFYPADTINQKLSMTFSSFVTDVGDHLIVYNGSSTAAPQIANLSGTIAPGTIISTASNGSLTFRFQNLCCNGTGAVAAGWAATVSCTGSGCTPPPTPTGFTATPISSSQINLSWNPVSGAAGYDIYYCDGTYIAFTSNTTYSHTGRAASTTYSYKISAQINATCVSPQTSCVNATTFNSPQTSVILFYNKIENNLHFIFPKLMVSAPISNIITPFKVCADGSQATFIEYQNNDPSVTTDNIYFRIAEDITGAQTSIYGSFSGTFNLSPNIRKVYFNHPTYMALTSKFKPANIQVIDAGNGNAILATYPMEIYRSPIVFVHGFIGNSETFENLRNNLVSDDLYPPNLTYTKATTLNGSYTSNGLSYTCSGNCTVYETVTYNPLVHLVDYRQTNGKSFYMNAHKNIIVNGIDSVFTTARASNYSCGKVVLIGHSMGGILSRLYLQSTYHDLISEDYRFDIAKLITVNTPHYGTQFANFMLDPINGNIIQFLIIGAELLSSKIDAINDMRVNSYATLNDLNIPIANQNKVPSHTISTIVTDPFSLPDERVSGIIFKTLLCTRNNLTGLYNCKNIFNSEPNDEIVPLSSQQGSFNWTFSDNNRFHVGSTRSDLVKTEVRDLINSNPLSANFSGSGFLQNNLGYNYRYFNSILNQTARILNDSIKILNIVNGQTFNAGDSISIPFSNSNGINNIKAYLTGGANTIFEGDTASSNSSIKFKSDSTEVGSRWIYLLGYDSLNFVDLDSVRINFNTSEQLDSIKFFPRSINLPLGYSETISINGYYHNGIIRNLRNVAGLTLAFDTSKIAVDSDYKISGKVGPFRILLTADYLNKQDTIVVETTANNSDNIADFSSDRNRICTGSQINYSDASLGIVQSRSWQFPGGTPSSSNLQNPTVTYNSSGIYNVTLVVTYASKTDTISRANYMTVNSIPFAPTINAGTATTFCTGGSVILTSNATTGNQWYKNGIIISGAVAATYSANASGIYTVKVTVNGCESAVSNAIVVTVNPIPATPTITTGAATTFCSAGSVTLTSNAASGNQWYKDGVAIGASTATTYIANTSGSYTAKVTLNGCESAVSNAIVVTVNPIPATPTITAGAATTFCSGGSVTLTSNAASGNQWYKDGVAIGASTATTYIVNTSGSYTTKVTLNGCESAVSNAIVVTVNPIPATPTITAGAATTFCSGGSVTLTSNAASGNQWYKDGVAISGATAAAYPANASGSYTEKVTISGCESPISNAIPVTVNSIPPTPTITQNGNQLTSSAASGNQWYLNGVAVSNATGQNFTPIISGNYSVQVTVNNCTSASSSLLNFTVTAVPNINVFGNQIKVLPNPVRTKLIISQSGPLLNLNIKLFDINGKQLRQLSSSLSSIEIDMTKYSSGIYIIWIEDTRKKIEGKKVIVKL